MDDKKVIRAIAAQLQSLATELLEVAGEEAPKKKPKRVVDRGPIPVFCGDPELERFLAEVPKTVQERWMKLYLNPLWIKQECLKALNWLETKGQGKRKDIGRFMSNWLERNPRPFGLGFKQEEKGLEFLGEAPEQEDLL
jgi:hypothetical protein